MPDISIRPYTDTDSIPVGILIADTYAEFNLAFASGDNLKKLLGPFAHAHSTDPAHQQAIINILRSPKMYIAAYNGKIVGVLRGRKERLASLFVSKRHHRKGIGRLLVTHFEEESIQRNVEVIRVAATLYAVDFYSKLGYKKTTGIRSAWSFGGQGLQYQPMKKRLKTNKKENQA